MQLNQALALQRAGRRRDAWSLLQSVLNRPLSTAVEYRRLAEILVLQERFPLALQSYSQALALQPSDPDLHYNLATVKRFLGDFTGAEAACDAANRLRPRDADTLLLLSGLRTQTSAANHIDLLLAAQAAARHPLARSKIGYALAKEYEDLGEFAAAFQSMRMAAETRRALITYDVAQDEQILATIASAYPDAAACTSGSADTASQSEPIFIIGLPRTGTTVVERLLASSGEIRAAGELPDFSLELTRLLRASADGTPRDPLELIRRSPKINFSELGLRYLRSIHDRYEISGRFIDKLPLNFLYVGLIHRALPQAKIVHVVRDPMDTCLAIYKQHFEALYPFSYDLTELGRYYVAYRKLMDHWRTVLPGVIVEVHYEQLVHYPQIAGPQLFAACQLQWRPECLSSPQLAQQAVTTASAVQVREGLHRRSIGRWRAYEPYLQDLLRIITANAAARNASASSV